ncbi:uncharacterized protein LOC131681975 isoform X2 [Topomyia yanbarensis]|uniref:uncharacterized protein LOC131681975 isoform X2 n=1 Tax=Topomyia yanbarensis TaxID=2498891 RepID=UPI00273B0B18|nr:uncharacterized protein LOC131681975 isoform X2 [Topomyia yanbarensis]
MSQRRKHTEGFDCEGCERSNSADNMVQCDACQGWYHLDCANVSPGVENRRWHCTACPPVTSKPMKSGNKKTATSGLTPRELSDASSKKGGKASDCRGKETPLVTSGVLKGSSMGGASSVSNWTPKKHPENSKQAVILDRSVRTSSSQALAQKALLRLKEKQELEERKLENQQRELEKARERLRKEKELEEEENAITKERLEMLEKFMEEKHDLEEQLAIDEVSSQRSSNSVTSLTRRWLKDQLSRNGSKQQEAINETVENEEYPATLPSGFAHESEERKRALAAKPLRRKPEAPTESVTIGKTPPGDGSRDGAASSFNYNETPIMQLSANQIAARQLWPKKLPTFSGDPEEWPIFYSSYLDSNTACGFTPVENVIRLRECLKGPARDAVVTKLMFPHAVTSIIETLRRLYGRPELLVKNLLGKVRRLETPKPERLDSLINFGMAVQQLCDHLEAANLRSHLTNPTLLEELVDKLPAAIKLDWVRHKRAFKDPSLKQFGEFMDRLVVDASEVTILVHPKNESVQTERSRQNQRTHIYTHNDIIATADNAPPRKPCPICAKLDHRVRNCADFKQMSLDARWRAIDENRLCTVCLFDHGNWTCKSRFYCNVGNCRARHHPLLHREEIATVMKADCKAHQLSTAIILFRVVPITLFNGWKSIDTFAFLDEGSSHTLIDASVTRSLGVVGVSEPLELTWTSNVVRKECSSERVDLVISARGGLERYKLVAARTVGALNLPKQSLRLNELTKQFKHLKDVPVVPFENAEPKVLIGLRNLDLFAPIESRVGRPGQPIAVKSALGWTIYGPCGCNKDQDSFIGLHGHISNAEQELNEMIRQQFMLEDTGIAPITLPESAENARARQILEKTTIRENGRFVTGLLWKSDEICFPDSLPMATKRLKNLERKLAKDAELRQNVHKQIREYIENSYAHKATQEELGTANSNRVWYLPLNVVAHPRKPHKTRLVWDAAAKVDGVSLNSQLLKGPDLLVLLPGVICKFRERRIGFGGDIEKMFHQIRIKPEDTHSQRFLFRFDESQTPDVYIMDVATFGASYSPCSAQHVMHRNADESREEFPEAVAAIKEKTYMDDYFDSADTPEEASHRAQQVKLIHSRGGLNMRNWISSSDEVLQHLKEPSQQRLLSIDCNEEEKGQRVLGIAWDSRKDIFVFSTSWHGELAPYVLEDKRPTKRIALRIIMSLFDPLGLLAPFLIHGRMLIQDLWRLNLGWDTEIANREYEKWRQWVHLLPGISSLEIPRCYFGNAHSNLYESLQLHVFTDASELGYGCAAYFRVLINREVRVALVMARSKVAPLKYQSIPRMELQAALLGARMMHTVSNNHTLPIREKYVHTDSEVVLAWIRSQHRNYKQFVAYRVGEILSLTEPENWRHVPSKENLADCLTKWGKDTVPESNGRWLNGKNSFLYQDMENWPKQKQIAETPEELRAHLLLHHVAVPESLIDIGRFSKWNVLLRTVALLGRFISNCRRKCKGFPIEVVKATECQCKLLQRTTSVEIVPLRQQEYLKAEQYLWRIAQRDFYPDETRILLNNRDEPQLGKWVNLEKTSPLYRLSPFADQFGVIRVEGRTANASYATFDARFPVILPKGHLITTLLLNDYHCRFGHANRETVVNEVRQRFYILNLRATVGKVMRECQRCKITKCQPQYPRMAPLPEERLTPFVRPFCYVGVDYLGPLDVSVGRRKEKRYVAVFTCLVTRAVHLEVAHCLSTDSCIMAVRRFIRRRGSPVEICSDNGTNFVGASNELIKQIKNINNGCADTFTDARTKWTFNPPSAPHMGGVWERMVRSVKEALRALDDGRKLNDEILLTVLTEAECFINSRPLTYMPQESAGEEAITPNHFILGSSSAAHDPLRTPVDWAAALRSSYQRSQYLSEAAWNRWLKEYFPTLNKRPKWFEESKPVQVGDLVYVAEGSRRTWIRGKVQQVIVGSDGRIRQAVVRTSSGRELKRPVVKLAVMEVAAGGFCEEPSNPHQDPRGGGCSGIAAALTTDETVKDFE